MASTNDCIEWIVMKDDNHNQVWFNSTCNITNGNSTTGVRASLPATLSISLIGFFANSLICYAIVKKKLLHLSIYSMICNMCISDSITLISVAINAILSAVRLLFQVRDKQGLLPYEVGCKLSYFILNTGFTVSTISLAVISIDRYYIIVRSIGRNSILNTKRKIILTIIVIWAYSMIINVPIIYLMYIPIEAQTACDVYYYSYNFNAIYFLLLSVLNYFIPLSIIVIMYIRIVIHLRKTIRSQIQPAGNSLATHSVPVSSTNFSAASSFDTNRKRRIAIIKMIVIATAVYMLTSLPYTLILLSAAFSRMTILQLRNSVSSSAAIFIIFGFILTSVACVENPIIYLITNKVLRSGLPKCLQCKKNRHILHIQTARTSTKNKFIPR